MKRAILIFAIIAAVSLGTLGFGMHRGESCPKFVGLAIYDLTAGEDEQKILEFVQWAVASGADQKRWPGTSSKAEAIAAYERSLRYQIVKQAGKRQLQISCLASISETAVDGPCFPGLLWYADPQSIPSLRMLPVYNLVSKVTPTQRIAYGLGLFPSGKPVTSPQF